MRQSFDALLTEFLKTWTNTSRKALQKPANGNKVVSISATAKAARAAYKPASGASLTLMRGDALEMMKGIADDSVDLIVTDPPYASTQLVWDLEIDLEAMWREFKRIAKPNAAIIIFGSGKFTHKVIASNFDNYRYSYAWIKNRPSLVQCCSVQPMRKTEDVMVFYRKAPQYHPPQVPHKNGSRTYTVRRRRSEVYGGMGFNRAGEKFVSEFKTQTNLLNYDVVEKSERLIHTQKPLELIKFLVETYTSHGDIVLDAFMGSGTTGVACRDMNRKFIGIERDENHFLIATNRIYSKSKIEIKNIDDEPEGNVVEFCAA